MNILYGARELDHRQNAPILFRLLRKFRDIQISVYRTEDAEPRLINLMAVTNIALIDFVVTFVGSCDVNLLQLHRIWTPISAENQNKRLYF